jgi:hypothetical protein
MPHSFSFIILTSNKIGELLTEKIQSDLLTIQSPSCYSLSNQREYRCL